MPGFEPWTSDVGSEHSTNRATTTALRIVTILMCEFFAKAPLHKCTLDSDYENSPLNE